MRLLLIDYDTYSIGKQGDIVVVNDDIAKILIQKYRIFNLINRIEKRSDKEKNKYIFIPKIVNNELDFILLRKNEITLS